VSERMPEHTHPGTRPSVFRVTHNGVFCSIHVGRQVDGGDREAGIECGIMFKNDVLHVLICVLMRVAT